MGKGSTEYEKELAKRIGDEMDNHNSIVIDEGYHDLTFEAQLSVQYGPC